MPTPAVQAKMTTTARAPSMSIEPYPDEAGVGLVVELLAARAAGDKGVEPADGAAGDGDEEERQDRRGVGRDGRRPWRWPARW